MALSNKFGSLLRQTISGNSAMNVKSSMYDAVRCMSTKLFIGGLSFGTDDVSLKEAFSSFGDVVDAKVITDRDTGKSRGFGFVNFSSDESANSAVTAMDGQALNGRSIRVSIAQERAPRFNGGGGGGYGGGFGGGRGGNDGY